MNASTPEIKYLIIYVLTFTRLPLLIGFIFIFHRLESFQKYLLFCNLLLPYYENLLSSKMAAFICRTIVTNLLHFVSHDRKDVLVSEASLKFLQKFASMWLSEDENKKTILLVIRDFFGSIVDNLVLLGLKEDTVGMPNLEYKCQIIKTSLFSAFLNLRIFCYRLRSHQDFGIITEIHISVAVITEYALHYPRTISRATAVRKFEFVLHSNGRHPS